MEGKVIGPGPYRATKLVSLLVTLTLAVYVKVDIKNFTVT